MSDVKVRWRHEFKNRPTMLDIEWFSQALGMSFDFYSLEEEWIVGYRILYEDGPHSAILRATRRTPQSLQGQRLSGLVFELVTLGVELDAFGGEQLEERVRATLRNAPGTFAPGNPRAARASQDPDRGGIAKTKADAFVLLQQYIGAPGM